MGLIANLKNIFTKKVIADIDEKNYLGVDINNIYNDVENTSKLCSKLKNTYKDKEQVIAEYDRLNKIHTSIQQIEKMNKKQLAEFENCANNYIAIKNDKVEYVDRIKGAGQQFDYLQDYEENIEDVIKNLKSVEQRQRDVKNDITYIEGEKGDLLYGKERLIKAQKFVKILMIGLLTIFAFSALILSVVYTNNDVDIFIPSIIMIVVIGFFSLWIYIFRRYVIHEIKKNNILMQRAVELLNKVKLKYVNNEQFLAYEYNKYKVKSGEMLEDRWKQFQQNKKDKSNIHKISGNIIILEDDIERVLKKHDIQSINYILDNIDIYLNKDNRYTGMENIKQDKKTLKNTLEQYNNEIQLITKILIDVRNNDTTNEKAITKIINEVLI
ncbi:hypothetical protein [Vallitalea guaymasensis]|uniref:Uncharacterized protein n=1 Tax=Vallitalea guaymasensis TaxID=1185412 RepID=A0A8J8SBF9_9FIRM|nr:hypothetical protein [Vallitalea guaymasensis]QUH28375.1 hypothetical protein HYG85_05355 [Vallitalea guaymasensis]